MRIYSIFDRKMREYGSLVLSSNDETVRRAVKEGVSGSTSTLAKYPEDFDVMFLGRFDPEKGLIVASSPVLVDSVATIIYGGKDGARAISVVADLDDSAGAAAEG